MKPTEAEILAALDVILRATDAEFAEAPTLDHDRSTALQYIDELAEALTGTSEYVERNADKLISRVDLVTLADKRIGDMTPVERNAVIEDASVKLKRELESPQLAEAIEVALAPFKPKAEDDERVTCEVCKRSVPINEPDADGIVDLGDGKLALKGAYTGRWRVLDVAKIAPGYTPSAVTFQVSGIEMPVEWSPPFAAGTPAGGIICTDCEVKPRKVINQRVRSAPSYRTRKPYGVRQVLHIAAYNETHPDASVSTCGGCGRSWDDAHITSITPAPGALCPFCCA